MLLATMVDAQEVDKDRFVLGFTEDEEDAFELYLERDATTYRLITASEAASEACVEGWQLAEGYLKLTLTREAAVELELDVVVVIQFPIEDTKLVRGALERIIGND